jgi:hypothetical protein
MRASSFLFVRNTTFGLWAAKSWRNYAKLLINQISCALDSWVVCSVRDPGCEGRSCSNLCAILTLWAWCPDGPVIIDWLWKFLGSVSIVLDAVVPREHTLPGFTLRLVSIILNYGLTGSYDRQRLMFRQAYLCHKSIRLWMTWKVVFRNWFCFQMLWWQLMWKPHEGHGDDKERTIGVCW